MFKLQCVEYGMFIPTVTRIYFSTWSVDRCSKFEYENLKILQLHTNTVYTAKYAITVCIGTRRDFSLQLLSNSRAARFGNRMVYDINRASHNILDNRPCTVL